MKIRIFKVTIALVFACMMFGCYPQGPEYYDQLDIVYTNHDKNFSFAGRKTFNLPDKVVKITGNFVQGDMPEFIKQQYSDIILGQIRQNMLALGYTEVNKDDADFIFAPSALEVTTVYADYWYDYWYWYYPYGWYYPYPVISSYTTGTLMIPMIDQKNASVDDKHAVVWIGLVNGLFEGTQADFSRRLTNTVDQAFEQSADFLQQ